MPKKADTEKDERVVARHKLLTLLRSNATILRALQVPKTAEDRAILKALARFDSPFDILRACGVSIAEATKAGELLTLALAAPVKKQKRKKHGGSDRCTKSIAGFCLFVLSILVGVLVLTITNSTSGWKLGTCSITIFTGQTCQQGEERCQVEVMIKGEGEWLVKKGWSLPIIYTSGLGGVPLTQYYGEALRCCNTLVDNNQAIVGSCCSMWDGGVQQFCDNWVHRKGFDGKPCPETNWQCMYQSDPSDGSVVTELMPHVPPKIIPLIASIGTIAVCLVVIIVSIAVRKAGVEPAQCNLPPRLKRLFFEEEEPVISDDEDLENIVQFPTAAAQGAQDEKRLEKYETSASATEFVKTQSEQGISSPGSRRKNSTISGSSKQSGATSSTMSRDLTSEPDLATLPGVVEGDEVIPQGEPPYLNSQAEQETANYSKYVSWTSLDKNREELVEDDIHGSFRTGDLSQLAKRAAQEASPALIEPLGRRTPLSRGHGRSKRSSSRNRQQTRPQSAGSPTSWAWAGQESASFEGHHVLDISRHRSVSAGRKERDHGRPKTSRSSR
eukprot:TRINITY_DN26751_c0_g1_i1.p1 TRINITY_DN26751_c0_g1~~TRINITY_DN26751_c0_g1_i1.p1  ORF type:complete len:557 (-),score=79.55 TRINITY_DN26751_c0_g1_i1:350-2020(-)